MSGAPGSAAQDLLKQAALAPAREKSACSRNYAKRCKLTVLSITDFEFHVVLVRNGSRHISKVLQIGVVCAHFRPILFESAHNAVSTVSKVSQVNGEYSTSILNRTTGASSHR